MFAKAPLPGVPTGFAELDRELPDGGWPRGGMTEVLPVRRGIGELSLLLPALASLSSDELGWLVCVASPYPLHAPALHACGLDLSRLLVASAPGRPMPRQRHFVACSLPPRPVIRCYSFFVRWFVSVSLRRHRYV
jgi:hypothetical protein